MHLLTRTQFPFNGVHDLTAGTVRALSLVEHVNDSGLAESADVELILVDWNMPVVGGVEFLVALRSQFAGKKPKVVFCTSENDVAHIARAMRAGADDYILKPFDREIVEAKLQEVGML